MNKMLLILLTLPLAAAAPGEPSSDSALADVERQIADAWNRHRSLRIRLHSVVNVPDTMRITEHTAVVEVMRRDGVDLIRNDGTIKMTVDVENPPPPMVISQLEIFDGGNGFQVRNFKQDAQVIRVDPGKVQRVAGGPLFEQLRVYNTLELLPSEKLGDQDVFVIGCTPKNPSPRLGAMRVYIDRQDGVLRKIVLYDESGKELRTLNLFDAEFDVELDPAAFQFIIPAGVKVIDTRTNPPPGEKTKSPPPDATLPSETMPPPPSPTRPG